MRRSHLTALAGVLISGCTANDPLPPSRVRVLQVLVSNATSDDEVSGLKLIYGTHPNVNVCFVAGEACEDPGLHCKFEPAVGQGHCVDANDKEPQGVARAVPRQGFQIRVVVRTLLDGETIEQFGCACLATPHASCPRGHAYSRDPETCSTCGDDPGTEASEAGRCLDVNGDRIPDVAVLLPGLATLTCAGGFTYTTGFFDGQYWPSGNQYVTETEGLGGLGPALVLEPRIVLPADSDCTVSLARGMTDRDGEELALPEAPVAFHTAP